MRARRRRLSNFEAPGSWGRQAAVNLLQSRSGAAVWSIWFFTERQMTELG